MKKSYSQVIININYYNRHGVIMSSGGFKGQDVEFDFGANVDLGEQA